MSSVLQREPVAGLLARLHARAEREDPDAGRRVREREAALGVRLGPADRYALYGDAPLAVTAEVGALYHLLACTRRPGTIVEFGASHGISTIYLAAALRDRGGGRLITSERLPAKARWTAENLAAAGLADLVEVREGDALQTLATLERPVEMLVLDGRNDQYAPVLDLLTPRLVEGAIVVADLGRDDPDLAAYQAHVRRPGGGFASQELPLHHGIELSVRLTA